jgi:hypothetical protein
MFVANRRRLGVEQLEDRLLLSGGLGSESAVLLVPPPLSGSPYEVVSRSFEVSSSSSGNPIDFGGSLGFPVRAFVNLSLQEWHWSHDENPPPPNGSPYELLSRLFEGSSGSSGNPIDVGNSLGFPVRGAFVLLSPDEWHLAYDARMDRTRMHFGADTNALPLPSDDDSAGNWLRAESESEGGYSYDSHAFGSSGYGPIASSEARGAPAEGESAMAPGASCECHLLSTSARPGSGCSSRGSAGAEDHQDTVGPISQSATLGDPFVTNGDTALDVLAALDSNPSIPAAGLTSLEGTDQAMVPTYLVGGQVHRSALHHEEERERDHLLQRLIGLDSAPQAQQVAPRETESCIMQSPEGPARHRHDQTPPSIGARHGMEPSWQHLLESWPASTAPLLFERQLAQDSLPSAAGMLSRENAPPGLNSFPLVARLIDAFFCSCQ